MERTCLAKAQHGKAVQRQSLAHPRATKKRKVMAIRGYDKPRKSKAALGTAGQSKGIAMLDQTKPSKGKVRPRKSKQRHRT